MVELVHDFLSDGRHWVSLHADKRSRIIKAETKEEATSFITSLYNDVVSILGNEEVNAIFRSEF